MGKAGRKHLWESDGNGNTSLGPALCQGTMDDKTSQTGLSLHGIHIVLGKRGRKTKYMSK